MVLKGSDLFSIKTYMNFLNLFWLLKNGIQQFQQQILETDLFWNLGQNTN